MMNARRHARDYERLIKHSATVITWAAVTLMTRRPGHRHHDPRAVLPHPLLVGRLDRRRGGAAVPHTDLDGTLVSAYT